MVPDPTFNGFKWVFKDGSAAGKQKLEVGKAFKLHNNGNWCHTHTDPENHTWTAENVGKTIKWSGVADDDLIIEA